VLENKLFIVMEYCDKGDLFGFLQRMQVSQEMPDNSLLSVGEARTWKILIQVCLALEAIHAQGVIHADLKPQNILLSGASYDPKLSDFGISQNLNNSYGFAHDTNGTMPY
jgi:serine/threonine protein kinase